MRNLLNKSHPLRWWWPAIVMMAIIFMGSTDLGAMSHQSRLLVPILKWLGFGDAAIHGIILGVRKLAHLANGLGTAILCPRGAGAERPLARRELATLART